MTALPELKRYEGSDGDYLTKGTMYYRCEDVDALLADAMRFKWCQDNPHKAQAMFWNHSSRRDRAKAIDAAMKANT